MRAAAWTTRIASGALLSGLVGLALVLAPGLSGGLSGGVSSAADPEAPHHAPAHWLPNEQWVWQHWLPFDEQRLYGLLGIDRPALWQQLRDDTRSVAGLASRRGWKARRLANELVAPRRAAVSPSKFRKLRSRALRTLTQGHLAQHIFFHSLHQGVLPDRASQVFGAASTGEFQRLRRAELSPLQIARLNGRSRTQVEQAAVGALREMARRGVRAGDISHAQASILLSRQLRQLPRWLGQVRYNGPPPLRRNPDAVVDARDYANNPTVSGDGRHVAFETIEASIPLANRNGEINVRMRGGGASHSRLVSVAGARDRKAPRSAYNASVSGDGRFVAYESSPGNLNFAKRYGGISVVVRDMASGRVTAVDPSSRADARRSPRSSYNPSISADGRLVAFESSRQTSAAGGNAYLLGVFVHDLRSGATRPLAVAGPGAGRDVSEPQISGDGRHVVYTSSARSATGGHSRVLAQDLDTGKVTLVSRSDGARGAVANGEAYEPQVSYDGRYVAFTSTASNLGGDAAAKRARVFVRDVVEGTTTLASVPAGDESPAVAGYSFQPALSGDGRFVAFASVQPGGKGAVGLSSQVFVHDLRSRSTELASRAGGGDGAASRGFSADPSISADGRYVAFSSDAPNLGDRKFDRVRGVFVRDADADETKLVSKGFTVEGSSRRKAVAWLALAVAMAAATALLARTLRRRRRLAVADAR